ncbi:hypothetical protein SAMN05443549_103371 [Flavobacterium fluvii]|uniref:Membrane domain of glycerophosphoryl diester phosphodiesterase n=1 Tax=Flavobacterium fluvii TaxID=468056 RepID=A0A1M5J5G4_9FLAO|nr:hypothetical protein [Flavobacterium fluvii]SHG35539.1 hypothetical protein SAMN05443549_103371 [Flavobacterium fluvii]
MFELYKKRDLSANFSDTIAFFKSFGKHYFKNYFVINGIFLMVLVVLIYFISKVYMELIFSGITNVRNNPNYLMAYFNNNMALIAGGFIITFLLIVILSMLNISFPVIYLRLIEKTNGDPFSTQEIMGGLKENIGKMIIFLLGSIFIILPLAVIVFVLLFFLCFILIGIPLIIIVGSAFMSWITLSYYEYILKDVGYFKALSNGFHLVKQQFWTIVGTTFLMMLLVQIIQGFITMIPYVLSMVWMFVSSQNLQGPAARTDTFSTMGIIIAVIMVFSVLLSYVFNNFVLVNQGLIYYGLQEEKENNSTKSQIDLIGSDIE